MNDRISLVLGEGLEPRSLAEISVIEIKPGPRLTPIRHHLIYEMVLNWVEKLPGAQIRDAFHAITADGAKYIGAYDVTTKESRDFHWLIAPYNANDGKSAFEIHSGIVLPNVDMAVSVHHTDTVLKKYAFLSADEQQSLVNESLERVKDHYNLEFERMVHLKKQKLTRADGHDLICRILGSEVVAGRLAHEIITTWSKPQFEYLKPRTMWSVFCLCSWFLNRLRASVMIERTINLHHFFDDVAKFDKKPTRWVQTAFA